VTELPYCSRCGVEVDFGIDNCPLCSRPIQKFEDDEEIEYKKKYPDEPVIPPTKRVLTPKQQKLRIWEILSASLLIPFLIVVFTDLIVNETVSWARFPMISLMLVWLLATFPLVFPKRPVINVIGLALSVMIFLILVDYFDNWQFDWFYQLALAIIALLTGTSAILVFVSTKVKQKGLNIAAFILFAIGIVNLGLDLIIMSYSRGYVTVTWSLFVLAPTVVIGGFLLYMHYRITKDTDLRDKLKRRFHF